MTAPWRLMLAHTPARILRVTARLRALLRTVVRRLLPPRTVPVSTLVLRMVVPIRVLLVRVARLRLLSLPLPRRLRLPRSLWQLSLPLRRFSRAQRPVLLIPVPLSPVPLVEMLLPALRRPAVFLVKAHSSPSSNRR